MKLLIFTRPALVVALVATLASCVGSHGSLSQKTRWYKHHRGGTVPCPCGH